MDHCSYHDQSGKFWQSVMSLDQLRQYKWHGWLLTYLSKQCFNHISNRRNEKKDPFKYFNFYRKVDNLYTKLQTTLLNQDLQGICNDMENILCVDTVADIDGNINDSKHDIIIICNQQLHELENGQNHLDSIPEWKIVNGIKYEFRLLIKIENIGNSVNWNGEVYSRHGGKNSKWWYFSRKDQYCTQYQEINNININDRDSIVVLFVKIAKLDFNSLNYEYLKYIGGQDHIFCQTHKIPLIFSSNRIKKCNCGRKEIFTCPYLNCSTCICQQCTDALDRTSLHHISTDENTNDNNSVHPDDELQEPTADPDDNNVSECNYNNPDDVQIQEDSDTEDINQSEVNRCNLQNKTTGDIDILESDNF